MILNYADELADPRSYLPNDASAQEAVGFEDQALQALIKFIADSGFTFQPWQVATFVTALRTKPFLIIAGISGTGKTKLPQLIADATRAKVLIVPVRPDWTDSSDLLGYERLNGKFIPGHLLKFCETAIQNPDTQYFFVLDEMNIARVEYYLAEVLSVMENRWRRHSDGQIVSYPLNPSAPDETSNSPAGPDWSSVYLPPNVAIIGTVNMDETTHGFSRKVLDRAFVLELSEVDLADFGSVSETAPIASSWKASDWASSVLSLAEVDDPPSEPEIIDAVNALIRANESLEQAQLQVGFRIRDEVGLFCRNSVRSKEHFVEADQSAVSPLDLCLSMKILPRLQGGGELLNGVLEDLASWTNPKTEEGGEPEGAGFRRTHERIQLMRQRLKQTGFTSYWM